MPYRSKKKFQRRYKKKKTLGNGPPTPPSLVRKLRYTDTIFLNPTTGSVATHWFSANGLFDPDITGAGHQPLGFDQYMTMYDHYKVLGSKINVTVLPNSDLSTQLSQQVVTCYLDDNVTATPDINNMIEQGLTSYRLLGAGPGQKSIRLSKTFSNKRFFKNKKFADSVVGEATANPSDQAYFNLSSTSVTGGDPGPIACLVVIDYIVQFSERKTLASS